MKPLFKKKKKLSASSLLLAGLFLCIVLSVGCSVVKNTSGKNTTRKNAESENTIEQNSIEKGNSNKISIVCTTFPQYDWVKNILGEEAERFNVTLLLDNGVDMHSYQPAVKDIATAGSSDLFIYVGGESDTWVEDVLKEAKNKDLKAINLMETLGNSVKEEEVVEGMQEERESLGHSHEKSSKEKQEQTLKESHENSQEINGQKEAADEEPEYDEHIWLSIRNAEIMVKNIEKAIEQLDSDNAKVYQTNVENYIKKLDTLDKQYANTIQNAKYKAILFGDRFPFRYMADDYDLKYYAAFAGCSAETMAGFETVTFLAKKADELRLPVILTIENSDGRIAEAVKSNTTKKNQKILAMNSLQSVTKEQIADGITYLQVMQENLSVLSEALN
ncbi:MAG: metal ABC transporter substrate-binding protein [Anaerobutyricum hallii]|uniref:metal ABC transporter substrate-binding protein n=1 Tax=Anaerobutyricum hallii TaxID=39488 RepID=UPI002A7F94B7|nr:metal ABC transporter substrate-binding protein [Anaerobutyricum hallii]MDY4579151.1 metal ABC transporter substrate-binding protein [Anaerobutyricum hallii]